MTIAQERTRSVVKTRRFLEELAQNKALPQDIREHAVWCLRHFPQDCDLVLSAQLAPSLWADPRQQPT